MALVFAISIDNVFGDILKMFPFFKIPTATPTKFDGIVFTIIVTDFVNFILVFVE